MRKKKLVWNTGASILYQITSVVCGFILPRLILFHFGSETNGLVNSITQFLSLIAFLELGVGAVVESAFYKPLAERDEKKISQIVVSANKFFRKLAQILLVYIAGLAIFYSSIVSNEYDWVYTATLIGAISISSFAQYYFGVVDRLLLISDQRGYFQSIALIITLVANTIACAILIQLGCSIHIVKLTTSIIYLVRPFALRIYVNRHYNIDRRATYEEEPITQKWNGVAQHVAAVVLDGTDTVVLSLFSVLSDVSIYSVYHNVVYGIKMLLLSVTNGIQAVFGELWAKKEYQKLKETFCTVEWAMHTASIFIFGCTLILIVPFVSVYTVGVHDADYIQPLFAILIVLAHTGHCLRLPYNMMILAAGHYKQTQHNYLIAAILNIIISVVMVKIWGLIGVAIGTLVAMLYQTVWMAFYNAKNLIKTSIYGFFRQMSIDLLSIFLATIIMKKVEFTTVTYLAWFILAVKVAVLWGGCVLILNIVFYKDNFRWIKDKLLKKG